MHGNMNVKKFAVRTFYKLVLRVLVNVALHRADYFSFGIPLYEKNAIDVITCQIMTIWTTETAYVVYALGWSHYA